MAQITARNLREKTDQELLDQMRIERKRLFDATVRGASGEAIKPHDKRSGKRLLARIQTILRERALRKVWAERLAAAEARVPADDAVARRVAARVVRPALGRVTVERMAARGLTVTPALRAAARVVEARRRAAALVRSDEGEKK